MIKKLVITLIALALAGIVLYFNRIANKNKENPPAEVIPLKFEFTTIFLIPLNDGYLLIDNAYEKEYDKFLSYLDENNIPLHEIKYILLTHHHDDHVGFLNQITSAHPDVRIILHKKTADLVSTGLNNRDNGGGIVNKRIYALFKLKQFLTPDWNLSFPPYNTRKHDVIFDGKFFDLTKILGINLVAVHTPGHSSDSVTYIYKNRYAFCGDLASNFLNRAGAGYLTVFNENISEVYSSWRKLPDYGVEVILPAHGKPFHISNLMNNLDAKKQENSVAFF